MVKCRDTPTIHPFVWMLYADLLLLVLFAEMDETYFYYVGHLKS